MAEDTVELMRHLEIASAIVVGYSDGGIIGLDMAIHHPERVTKLAVTGANARTDGYTEENLEWTRTFDPDDLPVSDTYRRRSPDGAGHWPIFLRRLKSMWTAEPSFTREELLGHRGADPDHRRRRRHRYTAVEMFRTIPDAQLCVVPNAGHGVMPQETILTFLQEVATGQK